MDTTEPIIPEVQSVPIVDPSQPKRAFPLWGAAVIAILVGSGVLLTWRSLASTSLPPIAPTPIPTQITTPTPLRALSKLASESAFLALETSIASLSSDLASFVTEDPSLTPPVLELPLGF